MKARTENTGARVESQKPESREQSRVDEEDECDVIWLVSLVGVSQTT